MQSYEELAKKVQYLEFEIKIMKEMIINNAFSVKQHTSCDVCNKEVKEPPKLNCDCTVHKRCLNIKNENGQKVTSNVCTSCGEKLPEGIVNSMAKNLEVLENARKVKTHLKESDFSKSFEFKNKKKPSYQDENKKISNSFQFKKPNKKSDTYTKVPDSFFL